MNLPSTPEEHDPEKSMTLSPTEQTIRDQILQLLRNRTQISDNSSKDFNTVESCVDKVIPHRKNLHSTWQKENLRKAWHELHKEFKELETESITFANKIIGQIDRLVEKIVPILGSNHSLAYKRICLENFISDAEQHRNAADGYISKFNDFMTKFSELTSNEGENESEAKSSSVPSRLLGVVDEEIDAINATLKLVIPDETACCYAAFTGAAVGAVAGAGVTLALGYLSWKTCVLFPVLGFVVSGFYKIYSQKRQDRTDKNTLTTLRKAILDITDKHLPSFVSIWNLLKTDAQRLVDVLESSRNTEAWLDPTLHFNDIKAKCEAFRGMLDDYVLGVAAPGTSQDGRGKN